MLYKVMLSASDSFLKITTTQIHYTYLRVIIGKNMNKIFFEDD